MVAATYGTSSAGNYTGYDQLGRVNVSYQQTDSINYGFAYAYNLASEMTAETYPSGRQVITEYDSAGRAAGIRAAAVYYAGAAASDSMNRIQYASHGAVSVMKLGNGKWEHTNFNTRLQPTQIGLGVNSGSTSVLGLDFGYGTTANNGNVLTQKITAPGLTLYQCYGYNDKLNRLTSADEHSAVNCTGTLYWSQTFGYDRYGNRTSLSGSGVTIVPPPTVNPATNRFQSPYVYDNAGNITNDGVGNQYQYDAENHQTSQRANRPRWY